jgi:hypothetical protein
MSRPLILCVFVVLAAAGCSWRFPSPGSSPEPTPSLPTPEAVSSLNPAALPTFSPQPSVAPTATPVSAPTGATAAPSASATPSQTPPPTPPIAAPNAPPRIVAIQISNQTVHVGDTISGSVVTSSNVASVEARIATFSIGVPKVGVGRFALRYVVPDVPFFFHGEYQLMVTARNTAGAAVSTVVPIVVQ